MVETNERIQKLEVKLHDTRKKINEMDKDFTIIEVEFDNHRKNMNERWEYWRNVEADTTKKIQELMEDKLKKEGALSVWKLLGNHWQFIILLILFLAQFADLEKVLHLVGK